MTLRAVLLVLLLGGASAGCERVARPAAAAEEPGSAPEVRRGAFEHRVIITGELAAAEAVSLTVPQTPNFQIEVRWLAPDGSLLPAGAPVAELDNSAIVDQLEEKEIALDQSQIELEGQRARLEVQLAEKRFAVEQKKTELEKARLDTEVPEELVSRREHQEKLLALSKARLELEKAEEDLRSAEATGAADVEVKRVEIEKSRREIEADHRALADLAVTTPVEGVWVVGMHPWEGRKIQIGDSVFVGLSLGSVPDLRSVIVEARLADVDDGAIDPGDPAEVILDAYPGRVFRGRVREVTGIAQELAPETTRRFFKVVVALDEVDTERLIPGMSARVEVIAEARADALLVPRGALEHTPEGTFVQLREARHRIELGPCSELECVVENGLPAAAGGAP